MADVHRKIVIGFCLLLAACVSSQPSKPIPNLPPNVAIFNKPYEEVWKIVITTVSLKHLLPLEVNEPKSGTFATKRIVEENTVQPARYRLTGTVLPGSDGVIVTLYKQQEVFEDGKWHGTQSDYVLEQNLLKEIQVLKSP